MSAKPNVATADVPPTSDARVVEKAAIHLLFAEAILSKPS
jgi:hypothetical protein